MRRMLWREVARGRVDWLLGIYALSLVSLVVRVVGSQVIQPCTELEPLYLLDEALPLRAPLPAGVSLVYDAHSHVHAYTFTSDVGVISFPSSRIFTKCDYFPEEFSVFVTLRYPKVPHDEECIFALTNSRTSKTLLSLQIRRQRIRFQYKDAVLKFRTHNLFDGGWHTLGISVSERTAAVTTDCRKIQTKKLQRTFPSLLKTTHKDFFIGSCSNQSHVFSALLKQLFILPGADVTARACSKLISGHADMDNSIPLVPGTEMDPSSSPENLVCTWKDVGNLAYDFRHEALKVCVNGVWQLVPFTDEARKRLDYVTWYQDLKTPAPSIDVDVFAIPGEGTFAALANTDPENSEKGMSVVYKWSKNKMTYFQDIPSSTAQSVRHFMIGSQFFLAVANYGNGTGSGTESMIFKWHRRRRKFVKFQPILTFTARDFEYFRIGGEHFLAVANYAKDENPHTDSMVYKWNSTTRRFQHYQAIPTTGAYDWTHFMIDEFHFLAVANAFNGLSTRIFSAIFVWQMGQFVQFQTMETTGATDFEFFTIGDDAFLAVANAYNYGPQNFKNIDTYHTNSTIYMLNRDKRQFEKIQSIPTYSAIDWEFFRVGEESYLIVSNAQNGGSHDRHPSMLYKWQGIEKFVPVHKLPTPPSADWEVFSSNGDTYLIYANAKASQSQILKVKLVK